MTLTTPRPESCRSWAYHCWSKNPPGATSIGCVFESSYNSLRRDLRTTKSFAYCSALTLASIPLPLNSFPEASSNPPLSFGRLDFSCWKNSMGKDLPNSHESTSYPFEIVYSMKSRVFVEFQSPAHRTLCTRCLPRSAFRPNVIIALQSQN